MVKRAGNFLTRLFSSEGGSRNPTDDRWWTPGMIHGRQTTAVSADTVLQIPEVYACVTRLAEDVGQLPFFAFEALPTGERRRLNKHPVTKLLGEQSNLTQATTAYEMRSQMTFDVAFHRNAYAEMRQSRGVPELIRLDPNAVEIRVNPSTGDWLYEVLDGANRRRVLPEEMLHLRMTPLDSTNLRGRSMLVDGYRVFSRILMMEDFNFRFYQNDARPGGVIQYSKTFKTSEDRQTMRGRWERLFGGSGRGRIAVLEDGETYTPIAGKNSDAQFIETYTHAALQVCRLFQMPPHKIGILDRATFSNIEQQSIDYVINTLMPLLILWEQAIKRAMLWEPNVYAHHNVAGLLRGDLKSRYEAYAIGRNWGWLSVNDVRRLENENNIEGGDIYLQPLNMVPAGSDAVDIHRNRRPGASDNAPSGALLVALENVLTRRALLPPSEG